MTPSAGSSAGRASRGMHAALFLLAASVLVLEVSLTRILSILLWSHYTFLVVSTALLGFGAAGTLLAVRRRERTPEQARAYLSRSCAAFAVTAVLSVMAVSRLGLEPTNVLYTLGDTVKILMVYALLAVPFFFAGLAICLLLSIHAGQITTLYFSDLVGAGTGALLVTVLLNVLGAPATIFLAATMALLAGGLFSGRVAAPRTLAPALVFLAVSVWVHAADPWHIPPARSKPLASQVKEVDHSRWTLHARIDVLRSKSRPLRFGSGVSEAFYDRRVEYRPFYMDGSNPSRMIEHGQDPWFLSKLLTASAYGFSEAPRVLIIGAGGGIDVMVALHHGAEHVTAIEINPETVDMVTHRYADYLGGLYARPDVTLLAREGRHHLTRDDTRYEVVRLTGVDTQAAAASGAKALDHAYIYTVEAVRDLYRHVAEDGVLAMNRPAGWQTLRLISVVQASLEGLGIDDVAARVAVVGNGRFTDVVIRTRPFRRDELARWLAWTDEAKLDVLYDPFNVRDNEFDRLLRADAAERAEIHRTAEAKLTPVTDDSPFFFERLDLGEAVLDWLGLDLERSRMSGYPTLLLALGQAVVLSVALIVFPLLRRREPGGPGGRGWAVAYFSLLGLGFILAELVFIQKYMIALGGPATSMSITLFSILVFSGLGAFAARHLAPREGLSSAAMLVGVALLVVATAAFLRWGLPGLLGLDLVPRVALCVASLAPVSFAMGWPLPLGIRVLDRRAPQWIPLAWASNACFTVIGSIAAIIVSMSWGFSTTLVVAAVCYVLAAGCWLAMRR